MTTTKNYSSDPPGTPPAFDVPKYVTRVKWRSPEWKSHTSKRAANAAASYHAHSPLVEVWEATPTGSWLKLR